MALHHDNCNLSERLSAMETTRRPELWFQVPITNMQPLVTPELGNSSSHPSSGSLAIQSISPPVTSESLLLITSSTVDTALLHAMSARLNALNTIPHHYL